MSRSAWTCWLACAVQAIAGAAAAWPRAQAEEQDDATADVRVEHFVLEAPGAIPGNAPQASQAPQPLSGSEVASSGPPRTIGVVAWRRRRFDDAIQLECETTFLSNRPLDRSAASESGERRVLHVEHLGRSSTRLVWRELGAGSGRSLLAEWTPDGGGLRTVDWLGDECVREVIDTHAGAVMPLYLIELVREGRAIAGRHLRFDPLARALEEVELHTSYEGGDSALAGPDVETAPGLRTVELTRGDGTLAGRCRFRGTELVAFQWQEGGQAGSLTARRVDAAEYANLLGRGDAAGARDP